MKTLLWLGIILSAGVCLADGATPPASDTAANTSVYASDLNTITQKCQAPEASVGIPDCVQHNLDAAKAMDDSMDAAALSSANKKSIIEECAFKTLDAHLDKGLNALIELQRACVADHFSQAPNRIAVRVTSVNRTAQQPSPAPNEGQQVGSSAYTTPSTCITGTKNPADGTAINNTNLIGLRRYLLAPKEASDIYGHRLGKHYIIYQVSVTDLSKDYQYVVHDITVNLKDVLAKEITQACQNPKLSAEQKDACNSNSKCEGTDKDNTHNTACLASSRRLELLRGVPEKGQDYDPRNLSLHIMTGVGSVAGGVSGLTAFSDVMGSAVSVFSGAFLQAFVGILPDHTGTQLNRLSDQAFASNSLVDKLHTKDFAIFIPQSLVLMPGHQSKFWKSPRELLNGIPLDQVDVCVDGSLVTEVSITPNPTLSPAGPNVAPGQTVTIQDSATDATIYFTQVDGTTPTATSDDKYNGPITLPGGATAIGTSKTIRAIAVSPNKAQSSIISQSYTIQRMPLIKVTAGAKAGDPATITFTPAVATDTVYYTTNGDNPTTTTSTTNKQYDAKAPLTLNASATVNAIESGTGSPTPLPIVTYIYTAK